jgi:hypothetical protein
MADLRGWQHEVRFWQELAESGLTASGDLHAGADARIRGVDTDAPHGIEQAVRAGQAPSLNQFREVMPAMDGLEPDS